MNDAKLIIDLKWGTNKLTKIVNPRLKKFIGKEGRRIDDDNESKRRAEDGES